MEAKTLIFEVVNGKFIYKEVPHFIKIRKKNLTKGGKPKKNV